MSARDKILDRLWGAVPSSNNEEAKVEAAKMLDAYAHELAEKIRNSKRLRDYTDDHMSDMYEAADEIDPEVTNA